jgi:Fur family transcriptional regulator, peroxide stress response regulator
MTVLITITDMKDSSNKPRPRDTRQRALIYTIVASTESHPTADWIYERARRSLPRVSLGTVYRNLQVLAREGKIRAIDAWGRTTRYDADVSSHDHAVCVACGAIRDVPRSAAHENPLPLKISTIPGFSITGHRLEFHGICSSCAPAGADVSSTVTSKH